MSPHRDVRDVARGRLPMARPAVSLIDGRNVYRREPSGDDV